MCKTLLSSIIYCILVWLTPGHTVVSVFLLGLNTVFCFLLWVSQASLLCLFSRHHFPDLPARGEPMAGSVRQHSLFSANTTKEYSGFVTSLWLSPCSERGDTGRVVCRLSHSPDETEWRLRKWGPIGREWQIRLGSGTSNTLASLNSLQVAVEQEVTDSKGLSTLIAAKPPGICAVKSLSSLFMLFNLAIFLLNASSHFCLSPTHPLATKLTVCSVVHRESFAK